MTRLRTRLLRHLLTGQKVDFGVSAPPEGDGVVVWLIVSSDVVAHVPVAPDDAYLMATSMRTTTVETA